MRYLSHIILIPLMCTILSVLPSAPAPEKNKSWIETIQSFLFGDEYVKQQRMNVLIRQTNESLQRASESFSSDDDLSESSDEDESWTDRYRHTVQSKEERIIRSAIMNGVHPDKLKILRYTQTYYISILRIWF